MEDNVQHRWLRLNSNILMLSFLFMIGLLISCSNNLTVTESKNISISLYFPTIDDNAPMVVAECWDSINTPDIFYVNHKTADSTTGQFSYWHLLKYDSVYIVDILYNNKQYLDTLILPNKVDSVFCNGIFLFNVITDSSKTVIIDTSSVYRFTWKTKRKSGYYFFEYQSNMKDSYFGGIVSTDTFFNVNRINVLDTYFDISFQIRMYLSEDPSKPFKEMNGIKTYYNWLSPRYVNHFFVNAQ
jgi:hypothetical protein